MADEELLFSDLQEDEGGDSSYDDVSREEESYDDSFSDGEEESRVHKKKWLIPLLVAVLSVIVVVNIVLFVRHSNNRNNDDLPKPSRLVAENGNTTDENNITEMETETGTEDKTSAKETSKSNQKENDKEQIKETSKEDVKQTSGDTSQDTKEEDNKDSSAQTEAPKQTEAQNDNTVSNGSFEARFDVSNSWESSGKYYYQFNISVKNTSGGALTSWDIVKDLGNAVSIDNFWNCNASSSGSTLKVSPAEYNKNIEKGKSISDIGLIIAVSNKLEGFSYSGQGNSSGNSQNNNQNNTNPTQAEIINVEKYEPPKLESGTPVGNHGQLKLKGTDIVDKNGKKYQLKGPSTHGIAWFPDYVNKDAFETVRGWGANMVRIAMYSGENSGYCTGGNQTELKSLVSKGVEACTELGMYVIIDWHVLGDQNPLVHKDEAIRFFNEMSAKYADNVNVIYEICNEPNGGTSWSDIKTYADQVIPVIRKNSPNALIIVGTPTWSQDVDQVIGNTVADNKNVLYAVHFYAATHGDNIRNKVKDALANGIPVFISEFSICDASGNGGIDTNSADIWASLINDNNLSYAQWSLCNKAETSALISSGCSKTSGWDTGDLSETGKWFRSFLATNN